jgi:hypothetical protein
MMPRELLFVGLRTRTRPNSSAVPTGSIAPPGGIVSEVMLSTAIRILISCHQDGPQGSGVIDKVVLDKFATVLAARPQDVEHGLHHVAQVGRPRTTAGVDRDVQFDQPLVVRRVITIELLRLPDWVLRTMEWDVRSPWPILDV